MFFHNEAKGRRKESTTDTTDGFFLQRVIASLSRSLQV